MCKHLLSVLVSSVFLAACGGSGGSGGSGGGSPSNVNQTPITQPNATSTTPNPSVPTTSDTTSQLSRAQLMVYNRINLARKQCGFTPLSYNFELEKAATNHNNYLKTITEDTRSFYVSHDEGVNSISSLTGQNNPYYTGFYPAERAAYKTSKNKATPVSYNAFNVGEYFAASTYENRNPIPATADTEYVDILDGLLSAPFHLASLMSPSYDDIGFSVVSPEFLTSNGYAKGNYLEIMLGSTSKQKAKPLGHLATYPCDGITDTRYKLTNETPNPFGTRNLATNPVGQPIYFYTNDTKALANYRVTLTQNNQPLDTIALTHDKDNTGEIHQNEFFIVPDKPLSPATSYKVDYTISYTDGTTESNSFTFTTKK